MATLALKPAFPIRTRRSGSKRDHRQQRVQNVWHSSPWRTVFVTAGAIAVTFFSVLTPMIDDPAGRLFALETVPTIPMADAIGHDGWYAHIFEFTPTMLGPAIAADAVMVAEDDAWIVTMPALDVRAAPPSAADEPAPPG